MSDENTNIVDTVADLGQLPNNDPGEITAVTDTNGNAIKLDQTNGQH